MLDPLRSLAELVRTLTRPRAEARGDSRTAAKPASADTAAPLGEAQALREKLRQRIRLVGTTDRRRAREVFVETVLAAELGERITLDPAMAEIVSRSRSSSAKTPRPTAISGCCSTSSRSNAPSPHNFLSTCGRTFNS